MLNTYEQNSKKKLLLTILAVIVVAGAVLLTDHLKSEDAAEATRLTPATTTSTTASVQPTSSSATTGPTTSTTTTNSSTYKDGTYSASSDYFVPSSSENIQVSLTLASGVVTNVSIKNSEGDRESARYQQDFASAYKSFVVGKKISDLRLGVIAGASDTTQGFNNALSQITTKARA